MQEELKSKPGPKTPEGKRRSSLNALKHGLTAVSPQAQEKIAQELEVDFDKTHRKMLEYFKPQDGLEQELVMKISECFIKFERCRKIEKIILTRHLHNVSISTSLESLQRYERSADLQIHRIISTIVKKREMDQKRIQRTRRTPPATDQYLPEIRTAGERRATNIPDFPDRKY